MHLISKERNNMAANVQGEPLQGCSESPLTGFFRDGFCNTGESDRGTHVVCAEMTQEFLDFTAGRGNDLSTPRPQFHFPGLKPGDRWCLCAMRWEEARQAGVAPPVALESTHIGALEFVDMVDLQTHALRKPGQ
jgi:hypothetical protein